MKTWIGAAIVAAALAFGGPAAIGSPAQAVKTASQATSLYPATDFSARRYHRYYRHYGYRYYRPHYYARPYYYRPYYYAPQPYYYAPAPIVPFGFGFGFGPWW
jgi:hypothetical protein